MIRKIFISSLVFVALVVPLTFAKDFVSLDNPKRPKIGLVLGGGGARGAAHAGVLKVLEENNVPIDFIVGTSMGSIVGGLYAAGMSPEEIEKLCNDIDWDDLFLDRPSEDYLPFRYKHDETRLMAFELGVSKDGLKLPRGVIAGQKLEFMLKRLTIHVADVDDFDNLSIPFRAVSTDLGSGKKVVHKKGDLAQAIRASMSIPGIFPPVEIDGKLLVDGYAVGNVPIEVAKEMGADIIIAVSVDEGLKDSKDLDNLIDVIGQVMNILAGQNVERSLALLTEKDLLIHPELKGISTSDFNKTLQASNLGEKEARKHLSKIQRYSLSDTDYKIYLSRQRAQDFKPFRVDFVEVKKPKRVHIDRVKGAIKTKPGEILDTEKLQKDLTRVYAINDFETVNFTVEERDGLKGIVIETKEKEWGPNYLRFGLNLSSDTKSDGEFNFLIDYRMTQLNMLGGEWRNILEVGEDKGFYSAWYQPIDVQNFFFVEPYFRIQEYLEDVWRGNNRIAEYRVNELSGGIDLGVNLSSIMEGRVGYVASVIDADPDVGDEGLPRFDKISKRGITASLDYDQFDNHTFPKNGIKIFVDYFLSTDEFGADIPYENINITLAKATTYGEKHTLITAFDLGLSLDDNSPFYDQSTLGGFLWLSGLGSNQLRGQHMGLARMIYYYRLGKSMGFAKNIHLGGSLEAGNVWDDKGDIGTEDLRFGGSAFIGVDTMLGPLYLAYGLAEGTSDGRIYLYLGKSF